MSYSPGTITLISSGEMTELMTKVHRFVLSRISPPVRAFFLDTPAGFQLNAEEISARAVAYFREHLQTPLSIVSFKSAARATALETQSAVSRLQRANYIFAGPGSPTYAIHNLKDTPVLEAMARSFARGGHLVFASAATIAAGHYSVPVYEIYKVGEEPHWVEGLNLLSPYGLDLAIMPHWNNTEGGTHDTRFCFLGEPRFRYLEGILVESAVILGIDEYTACIVDLVKEECSVFGVGEVILRWKGEETRYSAGSSFSTSLLRSPSRRPSVPFVAAVPEKEPTAEVDAFLGRIEKARAAFATSIEAEPESAAAVGYLYELVKAAEEAQEAGVPQALVEQAYNTLHELLTAWCLRLKVSPLDLESTVDPLVDLLVAVRSKLRAAKEWALADEIRDGLSRLGILLEDGYEGTRWRRVSSPSSPGAPSAAG